VRRRGLGFGREHQLAPGFCNLSDQSLDCADPSRVLIHGTDVDRADAVREPLHDAAVDFRILLAAVADQDELQFGIGVEDVLDRLGFMVFA